MSGNIYRGPGQYLDGLIAFLGASAFAELTLSQIYKQKEDGQYRGDRRTTLEKGIGGTFGKYYALLFAVVTVIACGLLLPGIQSNSISSSATNALPMIDSWMIGAFIVVILAVVIFGGIRSIANVATAVVPFMAIAYIIVAVAIVIMNIEAVPGLIALIFKSAFGPTAVCGMVGAMIMIGVKRDCTQTKGQGTGAHARCRRSISPGKQGLFKASVYIDTLFVCTATALMILMTGMYNVSD